MFHFRRDVFERCSKHWLLPIWLLLLIPLLVFGEKLQTLWFVFTFNTLGFSVLLWWILPRAQVRCRLIEKIGVYSYSIYVWHLFVTAMFRSHKPTLLTFSLNLTACVLCGFCAAEIVEFPVLKMRDKLVPREPVVAGHVTPRFIRGLGAATAIWCSSSGNIDTRQGGPNLTGSDVGAYGGPMLPPSSSNPQDTCNGTNSTNGLAAGWSGGTTGHWDWPATPVPDPYAAVAAATGMRSVIPLTKASHSDGVKYFNYAAPEIDGCPDTAPTDYGSYNDSTYWTCNYSQFGTKSWFCRGCKEYAPGYYPSGITEGANDVITFLPGVYYMDGDLNIGGSDYIRIAKPCANSQGVVNTTAGTGNCSPVTQIAGANGVGGGGPWTWHQTDGVMFYFHGTAKPIISGASGSYFTGSRVRTVPVTDLTCDGSTPPSYLGLGTTLNENVLAAPCTTNGTYWDTAGDTTDSVGNIRGLLMFMDHSDTASPQFQGSGALAYTGTFYFHSSTYATIFQVPGGTTTGTLIWGNIVTDQLQLTGSGHLVMALNPNKTTQLLKVGLFQ